MRGVYICMGVCMHALSWLYMIAKTRHTRVHGDITLPLHRRIYRVGTSHSPHSIPFVDFYEAQGLWW